jgi:hypothetical protein
LTVQRPALSTVALPAARGGREQGDTTIKTPLTLATVAAAIAAAAPTSFAANTPRGVAALGAGSGFQWSDAGIGAAAAVGSLLVLIGSSLILLRRKIGASGPTLKSAALPPLIAAQSTVSDVETETTNDDHD